MVTRTGLVLPGRIQFKISIPDSLGRSLKIYYSILVYSDGLVGIQSCKNVSSTSCVLHVHPI